jgi:hypothetical protein
VLIVYGSAVERSRALELGADDVVSAPIEPVEFHTGWVIGGFNGANAPDLASAMG